MKAAQLTGYGGRDSVVITDDTAKPAPGPGQVLIKVHAAGVNPFDVTVREGRARQMAELDLPATLGGDFAGEVADTGQAVYGQAGALSGHGSFAEYAPVKTTQLSPMPKSLDFIQAAALPLAGTSAYQALVDHMDLQKGQKILIHGGAGGIGSLAVQLARHLGAHVATTVSGGDIGFAKDLGADEAIDYEKQDFTAIIKDYDAVFDTVGGETNRKSYQVLKPGGKLVAMIAQPDHELVDKYGIVYTAQFTRATTERLKALAELVDGGAIKPQIAKVFPFDQAAEALEYLRTGRPKGKVVIEVA
jgi:NADPH:quinone reductase-like Zn-dependent oxidoreductase